MKRLFFIYLLLFSSIIIADSVHCLKWKKICEQKIHCVYRDGVRHNCFRCIKPNHYGFHLYPQQIDRNTCNLKTVHYLQTMGYRCFQPRDSQVCVSKKVSNICHDHCIQYQENRR